MKYLAQFDTADECNSDLAGMSQSPHLDNVDMAYKTYYSSVEEFPKPEFTTLQYRGHKPIPKVVIDCFRKGKFSSLLMDVICRGEVDHRIAMEDMASQWCHLVGLPIREIIYGIISGERGVTEQQRASGKVEEFHETMVRPKTPIQFQCVVPLLDDQYVGKAGRFGEEILLSASNCTGEFKKVLLMEMWFFFLVT